MEIEATALELATLEAASLELDATALELPSAALEDSLEIDAIALELLSAASEDSLEIEAIALELATLEAASLELDTSVLEARGVLLVGAKVAADEVAATGELDDDFVGEAASDGVEDGLAGAGALDAANAGTAAPARTRRWLSFMSKKILLRRFRYGKLVREAVVIVPLQLKSPWSLDLGKVACRGNEQVGIPSLCKESQRL